MATTVGTLNIYDQFKKNLANGVIDIDDDSFAVLLTTSSYAPNQSTHEFVDDVTNEVSGNGYARKVLGSVVWTTSGGANGQMKFDAADPVWTASGGSITCRYWVLFDDTPATDAVKPLIAYGLLDDTPADVVTTDTNTLTLVVNAGGFFTLG